MRLDRFLWWTRLAKTRTVAQGIAADGRLRITGRPTARAPAAVRGGDVLTCACNGRIRVIRVEALPHRRGPAPEAQGCYTDLLAATEAANVSQDGAGN